MTTIGMRHTDIDAVRLHGKKMSPKITDAITDAVLSRTIDGASTFEFSIRDQDRGVVRSSLFGGRVGLNYDDLAFVLYGVTKTGDGLTIGFESAAVNALRRKTGVIYAKRGTTTRTDFARRLVREVGGLTFHGEAGVPTKIRIGRGSKDDKKESSWDALRRLAGDREWRCFESEGHIYFGSDGWLAKQWKPVVMRESDDGIDTIDFVYDDGQRASMATVQLNLGRWSLGPGRPVTLAGMGPLCDGVWLIETMRRSLFRPTTVVTLIRKTPALAEPKRDADTHNDQTDWEELLGTGDIPDPETEAPQRHGWQWPCKGTITGRYGDDRGDHIHQGLDIAAATGTTVRPATGGIVTRADYSTSYGNVVYIQHDRGIETRYAHLSRISTVVGFRMSLSDKVGEVGSTGQSTGPHLHFEVRRNGVATDPEDWLP